jgi:hypothetical protein
MLRDHHTVATKSRTNKSKITNGVQLLRGIDMRSAMGRRFRDLCASYRQGLPVPISEATLSVVKAAAGAAVRLEQLQREIVIGGRVDDRMVVRMSGVLSRMLKQLGEAKAKAEREVEKGPTLEEYLARKAAERRAAAGEAPLDTSLDRGEKAQ